MRFICSLFALICLSCLSFAQKNITAKRVLLPNGWSLTPVGNSIPLGDLPLNLVVSPSQKISCRNEQWSERAVHSAHRCRKQ